ncbi:MAG: hypothetical protein JWO38_1733 [Gemmataceae bacterium]|nr:hypothetical protein [Gemmataceae bacterium]
MRIATWNLQSDRPLTPVREAVLRRAIDDVAADVWVVTEPREGFSPGPAYTCITESAPAADLEPRPDRRWVAIWSRRPGRRLDVTAEQDRMVAARIELPGGRGVVLVGTVLPWRADQRLAPVTGAAAFRAALRAQSAAWARLRAGTGVNGLCVAGDFNQELTAPLRTGTRAGLGAVATELDRLGLRCLTKGLATGDPARPVIDHICVGGGVRPTAQPPVASWPVPAVREGGRHATDHAGVFADLEMPAIKASPTAEKDPHGLAAAVPAGDAVELRRGTCPVGDSPRSFLSRS